MSRVLLVTTNFWPEPSGSAPYATDLIKILNEKVYDVTVLTGLPHYPWWRIPDEFLKYGPGVTNYDGVIVTRVRHYIPRRVNIFSRMLYELSFIFSFARQFKYLQKLDFDLVISIGSSLSAGLSGRSIAKNLGIPLGVIVHDLVGKGVKQSGLSGGFVISRLVNFLERKVLKSAKSIVAVSDEMCQSIEALKIERAKITLNLIYAVNKIELFEKKSARKFFGWDENRFTIIHTGNIGSKQDLANIVRAADLLINYKNIDFYIIGHGNQEIRMKKLCEGKSNIRIMPAVTQFEYSLLLSSADLLIVNERSTQTEMSLPSKLTSYLFSERPVIAAVPRDGATWKFLDGIAELVEAGNPKALADSIIKLQNDSAKMEKLAKDGLAFAKANLEPSVGRAKYLEWVKKLLSTTV